MKTNTEKKIIARFKLIDTKGLIAGNINPPKGIILEDNTVLWSNPIKARVFLGQNVTTLEDLNSSCAMIEFMVN